MQPAHQVEFSLNGVLRLLYVPPQTNGSGCKVTLRYERFQITAWGDNMSYKLPIDKQVNVEVVYVDAKGNTAVVDGEVAWASSNEAIATVEPNPDETSMAIVRSVDLGQAQITATADADLGEGVRTLITTMDVETVAGDAVAGTISPVGDAETIPKAGSQQTRK
jgi:Bacterial Ig-like domain (group 2)